MGFFDDDDFFGGGIDEFLKRFAGEGNFEYTSVGPDGKRKTVRRGKRNVLGKLLLNKVETGKRIYYIFDLSDKKNISAKIKKSTAGERVIEVKEDEDTLFEFPLEDDASDFKYKFTNGILEASYRQWKLTKWSNQDKSLEEKI